MTAPRPPVPPGVPRRRPPVRRCPDVPFDDCVWDQAALSVPLVRVPVGSGGGLRVVESMLDTVPVFSVNRTFRPLLRVRTLCRAALPGDQDAWEDDYEGDRWVTLRSDDPQEVCSAAVAARAAHGKVLCVGAGVGVVQQLMALNPAVTEVLTVEADRRVADLIGPVAGGRMEATDPRSFLERTDERFDVIYLHPFRHYAFDLIPAVNELAVLSRRALRPGQTSKVLAWGYDRKVGLFVEFCLGILQKLSASLAPVRMGEDVLSALASGSPMTGAALAWFREHYTFGALMRPEQVRAAAIGIALSALPPGAQSGPPTG